MTGISRPPRALGHPIQAIQGAFSDLAGIADDRPARLARTGGSIGEGVAGEGGRRRGATRTVPGPCRLLPPRKCAVSGRPPDRIAVSSPGTGRWRPGSRILRSVTLCYHSRHGNGVRRTARKVGRIRPLVRSALLAGPTAEGALRRDLGSDRPLRQGQGHRRSSTPTSAICRDFSTPAGLDTWSRA